MNGRLYHSFSYTTINKVHLAWIEWLVTVKCKYELLLPSRGIKLPSLTIKLRNLSERFLQVLPSGYLHLSANTKKLISFPKNRKRG